MLLAPGDLRNSMLLQRVLTGLVISAFLTLSAQAADSDRDFSGKWLFNADHSDLHALTGEAYPVIAVEVMRGEIRCTATTTSGGSLQWTYRLDGEDSKYKIGDESMNSAVK